MSVIGLVGCTVIVVAFAQDENVGTASERVFEDGDGALHLSERYTGGTYEEDIRVVTGCLVG